MMDDRIGATAVRPPTLAASPFGERDAVLPGSALRSSIRNQDVKHLSYRLMTIPRIHNPGQPFNASNSIISYPPTAVTMFRYAGVQQALVESFTGKELLCKTHFGLFNTPDVDDVTEIHMSREEPTLL
ncbi:hypothetical protein DUI87_24510 [Hirundo rustica rustica]|uniref:Uncharacterized protein n=1 Tax=Hirundo rustica rustica TaxID=333673 RepID=A0A3M0JDA9_HIRRU|nr:hypothetical protein DUI87_24510 [Hirundo rustica rustica]